MTTTDLPMHGGEFAPPWMRMYRAMTETPTDTPVRTHYGTPHKTARHEHRAIRARLADFHRPTHRKDS